MQSHPGIIPAAPNFPRLHCRSLGIAKDRCCWQRFPMHVEWRLCGSGCLLQSLRGTHIKAILWAIEQLRSKRWRSSLIAALLLGLALSLAAQAPKPGIVRQLSDVKFPPGDGPDCLQFFLENGDLNTGPSTAIMKAAPKCVVPPHYHTAEEQLIIVKGNVSTGMEGMKDTGLGPAAFAMMPSKAPHWFTCTAKEECLMFVTFYRAYDIVWLKPNK